MACTAFKRPTKKLGTRGLFILGLGVIWATKAAPFDLSFQTIVEWPSW